MSSGGHNRKDYHHSTLAKARQSLRKMKFDYTMISDEECINTYNLSHSKKYCTECNKEISKFSTGLCGSCSSKKRSRGKKFSGPVKSGVDHPGYGKPGCWKGKKRPELSGKMLGDNNPSRRPEVRCKLGLKGENNPAWQGGISFIEYPQAFNKKLKEAIRSRDNYQCQICGVIPGESAKPLGIHHIDYNKHNSKKNNLVTLCQSCHAKTNFYREYWKRYFAELVWRNECLN